MCDKPYTSLDKWEASLISGLAFAALSSPYSYSITNSLIKPSSKSLDQFLESDLFPKNGLATVEKTGCPTVAGTMIHAAAYMLLISILMNRKNFAECDKPYQSKDKFAAVALGGLLFVVISSPFLYRTLSSITSPLGLDLVDEDGCPNTQGLIVHTGAFVLVTRALM